MNTRKNISGVGLAALLLAYAAGAQPLDPLVAREAIVRLQTASQLAAFNAQYGTTTVEQISGRPIYLLRLPEGVDPFAFRAAADADPRTAWCELNYIGWSPEVRGRCFYFATTQQALTYLTQPAWSQINLPPDNQPAGVGMTVAVVDTGIDAGHAALLGRVVPGWNFVAGNADTADVGGDARDGSDDVRYPSVGHGTHVAGIIGRVALDALLLPIKVADSAGYSTNFRVAQGIFYAVDRGANVINVSIGSTYNSDAVVDALGEAEARGIPVVAASGNVNSSANPEFPACNAGAIGVAAVTAQDQKSPFSNFGPLLRVSAPGSAIFSTLPGDLYAAWDGTSMAAPMVSGAVARLLARHPEWPAGPQRTQSVRAALQASSLNIDPLNPGFAGQLGAGRLRVAELLATGDVFEPARLIPAGANGSSAVAAADLDGDGFADVVCTHAAQGSISVLRSAGRGRFWPAQVYPVGAGPCDVVAVDLDRDGDLDLAVCNTGTSSVTLLLNSGGAFSVIGTYSVDESPEAIAAGDIDGDSDVDLITVTGRRDQATILRNMGNAVFAPALTLAVPGGPRSVALADVDRDNDLDLLTVNSDDDAVAVYRNNGSGAFTYAFDVTVGQQPLWLAAADLDGDGWTDLAVAGRNSRDVTVRWNDHAGGFLPGPSLALPAEHRPARLVAADVLGDGRLELLVTSSDDVNGLVNLFQPGGGRPFSPAIDFGVGDWPRGVAVGDVDGDGDGDLVVSSEADAGPGLLLNRRVALPRGPLPRSAAGAQPGPGL